MQKQAVLKIHRDAIKVHLGTRNSTGNYRTACGNWGFRGDVVLYADGVEVTCPKCRKEVPDGTE